MTDECEYLNGILVKKHEGNIIEKLNAMWNNKTHNYPGPQPVSIERKHFAHLACNPYVVGVKNDGVRFCFFIGKIQDKYMVGFMGRNQVVYKIPCKLSKMFYEGCVFDGELVDNTYHMFDCVVYAGKDVSKLKFSERFSYIRDFCEMLKSSKNIVMPDNLTMIPKEFIPLSNISLLFKDDFDKTDGLIFMPENLPIHTSTHSTMFKWKPKRLNTVDFKLYKNKVYLQTNGADAEKRIKVIHSVDTSEPVIVECEFVAEKQWQVVQVRSDKHMANSEYTYQRTLVNIHEDIQLEEFINIQMECNEEFYHTT